jgi:hypothetical protein
MGAMEHGTDPTQSYSDSSVSALADFSAKRYWKFDDTIPWDIGADRGFEDGGEGFLVFFREAHYDTIL